MSKTIPTVFLILAVLFISSCTSPEPVQGTTEHVNNPSRSLILAIGQEPAEGFDPTTGWGRYGSPLFQSTLLKRDAELSIVNDLASGYEVSDDGREWTVTLRDDVLFSDGQPLTAEDVQYTFETAASSGSVVDLQLLDSVEAVNAHTVRFLLKEAQSTFVDVLITVGIVPKHAHGPDYSRHPVGSGPYQFVQWDAGQQLIVEANPEYYGPVPYFKRLTFVFMQEDAAYAAAQAGQVDIAAIPAMLAKRPVDGMELVALDSVDNRGISFPMVPSGERTGEGIPVGNDVTADPAIRKAINIAVDRQQLIDAVFEGYGTPAYSVADGMPWWNPDTIMEDGRFEEAEALLAEAGWVDENGDGVLDKDGLRAEFELVYLANDDSRQSLAIAVADFLRPLGIDIKPVAGSWEDIASKMHSQAVMFGWGSYDPLEMYNLYSSKTRGTGWYNPGYYSNPEVDRYLDLALTSKSEEEALQYWQKAQWDGTTGFSAMGDAPWAWLVNRQHLYLVNEQLSIGTPKIQPHGHGWPITDNIAEWRWKE
ncbi:ABC transporter substrate-binding protein [Paenibacillus senegalensis]|uniref:ABC transporter substrate-binding protein n=1 Tax=Paenibacillus senegalensis TaxID=1465766 RepID=UPI0005AB1E99|nr:ABC transporter substrate-binding protein [Paenibacillus senegalensis]